jgi:hypothetical protein
MGRRAVSKEDEVLSPFLTILLFYLFLNIIHILLVNINNYILFIVYSIYNKERKVSEAFSTGWASEGDGLPKGGLDLTAYHLPLTTYHLPLTPTFLL